MQNNTRCSGDVIECKVIFNFLDRLREIGLGKETVRKVVLLLSVITSLYFPFNGADTLSSFC